MGVRRADDHGVDDTVTRTQGGLDVGADDGDPSGADRVVATEDVQPPVVVEPAPVAHRRPPARVRRSGPTWPGA